MFWANYSSVVTNRNVLYWIRQLLDFPQKYVNIDVRPSWEHDFNTSIHACGRQLAQDMPSAVPIIAGMPGIRPANPNCDNWCVVATSYFQGRLSLPFGSKLATNYH